jgi:hypothetical protein
MNLETTKSGNIMSRTITRQHGGRPAFEKNSPESNQSVRNTADRVTISAAGKETHRISVQKEIQ